jgi:hypothetical protein
LCSLEAVTAVTIHCLDTALARRHHKWLEKPEASGMLALEVAGSRAAPPVVEHMRGERAMLVKDDFVVSIECP